MCAVAGILIGISAPVGAVLGHLARKQIRTSHEGGDGMALAGIIIGWVITGIIVLSCCGLAVFAGVSGRDTTNY